ncbi:heterokaryon incompatibility protein [Rutstroemia sp. NJR-2017a BVV2]|nr:heterokaryon incompatibility protein [Rutstroemia sp. NJR-2017a BVV2]
MRQLVKRETPDGYLGLGKILNPLWIDSSVLRRWKNTCDKRHGLACRSRFSSHHQSFPDRPKLLIDVWLQCLSYAPTDADYVALSYVWGSTNSTKTLKTNLEQFQRANSLAGENEHVRLPRTIRDAMVLTDILGERYLWVDSLCIVQDDEKSQSEELDKMASIYASASVTIVAAQGTHADFGLRGLQSCQARTLTQNITKINRDNSILKVPDVLEKLGSHSAWMKRGWTFQEHIFSHRLLIFNNESVYWECDHGVWYENIEDMDINRLNKSRSTPLDIKSMFTDPLPSISRFFAIVDEYMNRNLTYPEDKLRAFAGISRALESTFDGGFVCGLPVLWLDIALLWQPKTDDRLCHHRQGVGRLCPDIPSWSWANGIGRLDSITRRYYIDYIHQYDALRFLKTHSGFGVQIIPIVKWVIRENVESSPTMLQNTWFQYKRQAEEENRLPPGWEKHDGPASIEKQSQLDSNIYYTYGSDPHIPYCYPVPQRDSNVPRPPKWTLLSCHTKRAWLRVAEMAHFNVERTRNSLAYQVTWTVVRTADGVWAGALRYDHHGQEIGSVAGRTRNAKEAFDEPDVNNSIDTKMVELVAISRGCTVRRLRKPEKWQYVCPELDHDEAPNFDDEKPYEFYNCLWIGWKDGIAYRKALGRVEKSVWEALELEEIELILG